MIPESRTDDVPTSPRRRAWIAPAVVFALAMAALAPTVGDFGLTWDEPFYRLSQIKAREWCVRAVRAIRSPGDLAALFDPNMLLYHWDFGRAGLNFHPPLASMASLVTYELFGGWMKDIPARRMASVLEFAATIAILHRFLARRYGPWVGCVAATALPVMPRIYGDMHIAGTDPPGLLLWFATAVAFWKGISEPDARRWRVAAGVGLGLAFVEKLGAVAVVVPMLLWLAGRFVVGLRRGRVGLADWADGLVTSAAMLVPLALIYREVVRLGEAFFDLQRAGGTAEAGLSLNAVDLFTQHPPTRLPDWALLVPLAVWFVRRGLGRALPGSRVWGAERPALEAWTAMLAFAPVVSWLGNPAWWREALPRLAHYHAISVGRRGALPGLRMIYFGQTYEYSLPWHNAWVWIAITVPVGILAAAVVGLVLKLPTVARDRVPAYFLVHLVTLPVVRMFPTPAHDGVRLFLPTFCFLAAFAGWGAVGLADRLGRSGRGRMLARSAVAALVLGPAAWALVRVHPYELSYYNTLIGGPRGAWARGFELTYWYDALNPRALAEVNRALPDGAAVELLNPLTISPTFKTLQDLGAIGPTVRLREMAPGRFPHLFLLTQDSKATAFTRLAFAMTPLYESRPRQLDGLRAIAIVGPETVARASALQLFADVSTDPPPPIVPPAVPGWVRSYAPPLARLWGRGLTPVPPLRVNAPFFAWAESDPESLRRAVRALVDQGPDQSDTPRLAAYLTRDGNPDWSSHLGALLEHDPKCLVDAVEIFLTRREDVRTVLTRHPYTDPASIGGPLDRDLPVRGR